MAMSIWFLEKTSYEKTDPGVDPHGANTELHMEYPHGAHTQPQGEPNVEPHMDVHIEAPMDTIMGAMWRSIWAGNT